MGVELTQENDTAVRWKEYFVQLLNVDEITEIGIRRVRIGWNERVARNVVREEIMGELKKMKGGKAAGMDGIII